MRWYGNYTRKLLLYFQDNYNAVNRLAVIDGWKAPEVRRRAANTKPLFALVGTRCFGYNRRTKVVTTSTHQRMSINVRIKATKERRKIDVLYQRAIYQTTIYRQFCKLSKIYLFILFTYIIYIIMQYKSFAYFRRPKATSLKSRNRRVETFIRYPSVVSSIFGRSGVALWANLRRMNRGRGLKRDALFSAATKLYSRVP